MWEQMRSYLRRSAGGDVVEKRALAHVGRGSVSVEG